MLVSIVALESVYLMCLPVALYAVYKQVKSHIKTGFGIQGTVGIVEEDTTLLSCVKIDDFGITCRL